LGLQPGDIDSARMKVHVRQGKGRTDRFVTLPKASPLALRKYWVTYRNPDWLFPAGKNPEARRAPKRVMGRGGLQNALQVIVKSCGLRKAITPHSLRHCYGAHLMEAGLNLRAIQYEMGHECPKTTAVYTQLTDTVNQHTDSLINALMDGLTLTLDGEVEHEACRTLSPVSPCVQSPLWAHHHRGSMVRTQCHPRLSHRTIRAGDAVLPGLSPTGTALSILRSPILQSMPTPQRQPMAGTAAAQVIAGGLLY